MVPRRASTSSISWPSRTIATCTRRGASCCAASVGPKRPATPTAVRWRWSTTTPSGAGSSSGWQSWAPPTAPPGTDARTHGFGDPLGTLGRNGLEGRLRACGFSPRERHHLQRADHTTPRRQTGKSRLSHRLAEPRLTADGGTDLFAEELELAYVVGRPDEGPLHTGVSQGRQLLHAGSRRADEKALPEHLLGSIDVGHESFPGDRIRLEAILRDVAPHGRERVRERLGILAAIRDVPT